MILTIDTSKDTASLALVRGHDVTAESIWHCEQSHTTELIPHLACLLDEAKATLQSIEGVIVAIGPGSYNGLRVGISTAKGLVFSLGIPLVGISSLEVEAYRYANASLPVCAVSNAGREEIAAAIYQIQGTEWHRLLAEHITTVEALCSQITAATLFCGESIPLIMEQIRKRLKEKAIISPTPAIRQQDSLAELGGKRLEAGHHDNPTTLQPLYLRQPHITQPKHR